MGDLLIIIACGIVVKVVETRMRERSYKRIEENVKRDLIGWKNDRR